MCKSARLPILCLGSYLQSVGLSFDFSHSLGKKKTTHVVFVPMFYTLRPRIRSIQQQKTISHVVAQYAVSNFVTQHEFPPPPQLHQPFVNETTSQRRNKNIFYSSVNHLNYTRLSRRPFSRTFSYILVSADCQLQPLHCATRQMSHFIYRSIQRYCQYIIHGILSFFLCTIMVSYASKVQDNKTNYIIIFYQGKYQI